MGNRDGMTKPVSFPIGVEIAVARRMLNELRRAEEKAKDAVDKRRATMRNLEAHPW